MKSILRRTYKRYDLAAFFLLIVLVIVFFVGRASAVEKSEVKFLDQKPEQYIVALPATTTTSTTTTVVPVVRSRQTQPVVVTPTVPPTPIVLPSGTHADWMAQAGIPQDQWPYVELLIQRESGWRPEAVNGGGCIGLGQNCGVKWLAVACPNWPSDPVCQLRRFNEYAQRWNGWNGHQGAWKGSWMHSEGTNPHWY